MAGAHDLDDLSALQGLGKGHHCHIGLGAAAAMTDLGVHGIGEIQGRRPVGQLDDPAFRGQDVDMGLERLGPELLDDPPADDPLPGAGARTRVAVIPGVGSKKPLEPGDPITPRATAFLVAPMRGHPQLGVAVHGVGADLHLHDLVVGTQDGGVE